MSPPTAALGDDPLRIREHLHRSRRLAHEHGLPSVVVGIAADEGDQLAPELLAYVESALRVEDAVFRLTRERAVLFLADVDRERAGEIMDRIVHEFAQRFPAVALPRVCLGFFEVAPGCAELLVRDVLPAVFPPPDGSVPS
jgi:ABC-type molybdate transport system ATPase subunit